MSFARARAAEAVAQKLRQNRRRWADLVHSLKRNQLPTLSLGWTDSDFLQSERSLAVLSRAWQANASVTVVTLGWKIGQASHYMTPDGEGNSIPVHGRNRRLLCQTLHRLLVADSPHALRSVRLVLDEWVPAHVLQAMLARHACSLECLEFHGVSCRTVSRQSVSADSTRSQETAATTSLRSDTTAAGRRRRAPRKQRPTKRRGGVALSSLLPHSHDHSKGPSSQQETPAVRTEAIGMVSVILPHIQSLDSPLISLKLIDCALVDEDVVRLMQALPKARPMQLLSVRSNRRLTGKGAAVLLAAAPADCTVDLSLCDFDASDGRAMRDALAQRDDAAALTKLSLCGNYQLDAWGLEALVAAPVLRQVRALDLSYCELNEMRTTRVLEGLLVGQQLQQSSVCREVVLQGCTVTSVKGCSALCALLASPDSLLRRIVLNDPVETGKYWSTTSLQSMAEAVAKNYDVEDLVLDYLPTQPNAVVWKMLVQPWLNLNRLGRRVVRPGQPISHHEWVDVVHRASTKDMDTLFWFVRHSAERVGGMAKKGAGVAGDVVEAL
jgi:hypothetical protein